MTREQAKQILAAYRPDDRDKSDPAFAEALQETQRDEELARWFAQERAFDSAIAARLDAIPAPFGLKTRILANAPASRSRQWGWAAALASAAAALFLLAQVIGLYRDFA